MSWNKLSILSTGCESNIIFNNDGRIAWHKTPEVLSHIVEGFGLEWMSKGQIAIGGGNVFCSNRREESR